MVVFWDVVMLQFTIGLNHLMNPETLTGNCTSCFHSPGTFNGSKNFSIWMLIKKKMQLIIQLSMTSSSII
jgi:hypothetical protein